jgi:outer membrane beta-barrel protein
MRNPAFFSFVMVTASMLAASAARAADPVPEPVIPAQVDRRDVHIPKIKASDVEIGAFVGILSVQNFGAKPSAGLRLGYHVTEDFFLEGTYGRSKVSDQSYRQLGIPIFSQQEIPLSYYYLSVGCNLFPGEVFLGRDRAITSAVYLIGGVGNVNFNKENHTAFSVGIGIRFLPTDWFSLRFEMRDQMFTSDLLGNNELKHNFEMTLGAAGYF